MEDKELDQMLKKALIPNIKDNETKIRFEMEDCVMRKQKKILKPVVALAACAALVIGISYGNVTEKIIGTHMLSSESDNSATGKTELLRMISDYENNGISSGITQICEKRCVVMENASWKERLATLQQCIIFIDEGAPFLRSKEFTRMVKGSDNYFVLVTRDSLEHLPYSIEEIYGMRQERDSQKYQNAKRIYNETYQLYNLQAKEDIQPDLVITEDSNSGYEFYHKLFGERKIVSQLPEQIRINC